MGKSKEYVEVKREVAKLLGDMELAEKVCRIVSEAYIHPIQIEILELMQREDINDMTLREIGEKVGETSPQLIKHHKDQVYKKGLVKIFT